MSENPDFQRRDVGMHPLQDLPFTRVVFCIPFCVVFREGWFFSDMGWLPKVMDVGIPFKASMVFHGHSCWICGRGAKGLADGCSSFRGGTNVL